LAENYYNIGMEQAQEIPDNIKCPYCGAANSTESQLCGVCAKNLRIPDGVRAEARARKMLGGGVNAGMAEKAPAAGKPARLWARIVIIAVLFWHYLQWFRQENYFSPLDHVNLAFHEAGHIFLVFFPQFIVVLGGTLFQLALPAACLVHLWRRGANLGWQLCLFWLGENLLNISNYAGDAIKQELPLVGGGGHDWTYLLTETGLIGHTVGVEKTIFFAGSVVIFWSFFLIARDALRRESMELGSDKL